MGMGGPGPEGVEALGVKLDIGVRHRWLCRHRQSFHAFFEGTVSRGNAGTADDIERLIYRSTLADARRGSRVLTVPGTSRAGRSGLVGRVVTGAGNGRKGQVLV